MVHQQLLGSLPRSALSALLSCSCTLVGGEVASPTTFQPVFHVTPWVGVTNTCSLVRGKEGAARPSRADGSCLHQHYRLQQNTDFFLCGFLFFFFFFPLSFSCNITCSKKSV